MNSNELDEFIKQNVPVWHSFDANRDILLFFPKHQEPEGDVRRQFREGGEAGRAVLHCRMEGALDTEAALTVRKRG